MIDIKTIDRNSGFDTHDLLRDGKSSDFDVVKVSAVIKVLVDEVNRLSREIKLVKRKVRKKKEI